MRTSVSPCLEAEGREEKERLSTAYYAKARRCRLNP
jgi:hypothetical protein